MWFARTKQTGNGLSGKASIKAFTAAGPPVEAANSTNIVFITVCLIL